jgi:hypothetical protein
MDSPEDILADEAPSEWPVERLVEWASGPTAADQIPAEYVREWYGIQADSGWVTRDGRRITGRLIRRELSAWWRRHKKNNAAARDEQKPAGGGIDVMSSAAMEIAE